MITTTSRSPAPSGGHPAPAAEQASTTTGTVDALVDATPDSRDRLVDGLRALSILVVVLWHWVLSITHVNRTGTLVMPNPIDQVRGLWIGTWLLQIMPLFFVVGGYANLAAWDGLRRRGATWTDYARKRVHRLVRPVAVYLVIWAVVDTTIRMIRPGTPSVWTWGRVVFIPLWFLGSYLAVVLVAPALAAVHRRRPLLSIGALGSSVLALDLARFHLGWQEAGLANSLLVWVFAHQLGFFWRDGTVTRWSTARRTGIAAAGLLALIAMTLTGWYPRSMVAVRGEDLSNMFPTTAAIAALAVFQFGLIMTLRPALGRFMARRRVWKATVAANGVAMTVFTWHMTALVIVIGIWRSVGLTLADQATGSWWSQRPVWLLAPGVVLAGLVALFARFETGARRSGPSA